MPQLDKVTFLSQFFWLCFFFLGFNYFLLKFYLPKISRLLALRRKKMGFSQDGVMSLQQENLEVKENYESVLSQALKSSKTLFTTFFSRTSNWLETTVSQISQTHLNQVNNSFMSSLGESSLSQNLFFYHASKNLPERLAFHLLLSHLQTQSLQLATHKGTSQSIKKIKKTKN
jgi:hypothetical protein